MDNAMHKWRFFKSARCVQVKLENDSDLRALAELDRKLWTVLSSPVKGVRFDAATLKFLDADGDGRIRAAEVQSAVDWMARRFKSLDFLFARKAEVALDSIDDATDEGRALRDSFRRVLERAAKAADSIALADISSATDVFNAQPFNGDGVVTPDSTCDAALSGAISTIVATMGGVKDRSGADGIDRAKSDAFFAAVAARRAWIAEGRAVGAEDGAAMAVYRAYDAVRAKIDEFFTPPADLPLVTDAPDVTLPLTAGVHPAWAGKFAEFAHSAAAPALGVEEVSSISRSDWTRIKARFAPCDAWLAAEAGREVSGLSHDELEAFAKDGGVQASVNGLLERDIAFADEHGRLRDCERALRYAAHLVDWLSNFVNQSNLYDLSRDDIYRTGVLYVDGRAMNLCFHVDDEAAHSAMAKRSKCCLLYVRLTHPATGGKREICAVVTAGVTNTLYAGRNGVFVDVDGTDWDAVVSKVVEAQVSLREAFWSPWARIAATVSEQCMKFLSTKQDAAVATVGGVAAVVPPAPASAAPPASGAAIASGIAALGVGVGMAGAACAGLVGLVAGLPLWKVLGGVVAIILMVSLPSVAMAWFKLRARDLGAILNAGGWAVNRPLRFSAGLARTFTVPAKLPASAVVARDPYARHGRLWMAFAAFLLVVAAGLCACWRFGVWPFGESCAEASAQNAVETEETVK